MSSNWNVVPFTEAVDICDTLRKPINSSERASRIKGKEQSELYPYYGATGQVGFIDDYITDGEYVLLGEDGAPFLDAFLNKAYIISGKTWVNNHAHVLRSKTNNKFLCYYLNSFNYKGYVSGTTRLKLTQAEMKRIPVPVPPLSEQERIVARIEELFSQLDAGVETLKKTKAQLAVYRQAVVEDAIATAKHRGATVLPFGTFVLQYQNGISKRSGEGIQTPVLRLADIENQRISNDDGLRLIGLSKIERDRFVLKRGDLLIVRVNGSENNVGRSIVVDKDDSYAACDHFIRCSVDFSHIIPEYAQLLLDSFSARKHIKENMVSSAGQNTVSQTTMSSIMVYVPNISVQEKIMVSVNERMSVCDSIEHTVDIALQQAEAMRQSILKDAFEGRL